MRPAAENDLLQTRISERQKLQQLKQRLNINLRRTLIATRVLATS